jgi:hypothetical protein
MCHKTKCLRCGKWTWGGCGKHLAKIFEGIPVSQLCKCGKDKVIK